MRTYPNTDHQRRVESPARAHPARRLTLWGVGSGVPACSLCVAGGARATTCTARAAGAIHPTPAEVPHARSTSASPACHAGGSRITCRGVRKGIRKVEGAHACAGDGRRGFDRHCADRLLTADEEVAKKSGAGRRKIIAQAQLLVDQICGLGRMNEVYLRAFGKYVKFYMAAAHAMS